jgi:hypothetical protein
VFEEWRHILVPHRRLLKNEVFSNLLIVFIEISVFISTPAGFRRLGFDSVVAFGSR